MNANLDVATRDFKYYVFDWDDNILHMPTRIYMEKRNDDGTWSPVALSTGTYALVRNDTSRYRLPSVGGREAAFRDFQDAPDTPVDDRAFIRDTRSALARIAAGEKPGPSFETLRKTLREGRIFAIVTARGHAPETIKQAVRVFIDEVLSKEEKEEMMTNLRGYRICFDKVEKCGSDEEELSRYLSLCRYHAVTNPDFRARMAEDDSFSSRIAGANKFNGEIAKEFAIRDFIEHIIHTLRRTGGTGGRQIAIGFSDDDSSNVRAVSDFIREELSSQYSNLKFVIYDTSDPSLANGRKVTVSGQLDLPGF